MSEVPAHAKRVFGILGEVPQPHYSVVVDNRFIGRFFRFGPRKVETAFTPKQWKSLNGACARLQKERTANPRAKVEVLECYGSFVEHDCADVSNAC